jgi:hypothetical protein
VANKSQLILTVNGVEVGRKTNSVDYPDVYGLTNGLSYTFPTTGNVKDFLVELTLKIFRRNDLLRTFTAAFTMDPLIPYVNPDVQISNLVIAGNVKSSLSDAMLAITNDDEAIVKYNGIFAITENNVFIKEASMLDPGSQYELDFDDIIGKTVSYDYTDPEVSSTTQHLTSSPVAVWFDDVALSTGQRVTMDISDNSAHTIRVEFDILDPNGNVYEHRSDEIIYRSKSGLNAVYEPFSSSCQFTFNFQYRIPNTSVVYNCSFKHFHSDGTTNISNENWHTYPPVTYYAGSLSNLGGGPVIYGDWETDPYSVILKLGDNNMKYYKKYYYKGNCIYTKTLTTPQQVYWDGVLVTSDKEMTFSKSQANETHILKVVGVINGEQKEYNFTYYVLLNS